MVSNVEQLRVVNLVNQKSLDDLKCFLHQNDFRIFELDGETVKDKASFFTKAGEQLPHEPGLVAQSSWDAMVDTIGGGLAKLGDKRVAFVWTKAEKMIERGLPDLLIAVDCFQQLSSDVATTKHGFPHPMLLRIFLVGEGDNFKPF